jgi:ribosomal protein S12 methylthiotransferase
VKELVLVAEDSTAWGREHGRELPDLVEALAGVDSIARIRVMYAYPNRFPWRLTEVMRAHENVVPYLDIPMQHIATPMLRAMRRAGSGDQVRKILDRLKSDVPGITLRTTLLMGFPGETDADAAEAVDFVREYEIARLGAFTYSPEQGTPGFDLPSRVPADVAKARYDAVMQARDAVLSKTQGALVGREVQILVDESHPDADAVVGRTAQDAPEVDLIAVVRGSRAQVGQFVRARVDSLDSESNLVCSPLRKR